MAINKGTIIKEIDGSIKYIYPKTSADMVEYTAGISVQNKISELISAINNINTRVDNLILNAANWQGDTRYITTEIDTAEELNITPIQATAAVYSRSSGTVPITFTTTGSKLVDYSINGTYEGVGDSSINYFSGTLEHGGIYFADGQLFNDATRLRPTDYVELEAGDYLISIEKSNTGQNLNFSVRVFLYDAGDTHTYVGTLTDEWTQFPFRFTVEENQIIKFAIAQDTGGVSTPLDPAYISVVKIQPRKTITNGYTIPVVVSSGGSSQTTTLTVNKPLELSDTLTLSNTGVDIPTSSGENTLTVNTESKPTVSILYT